MSTAVRTPIPLSRRLLAGAAVTITLAAGVAAVVSLDGSERAANDIPTRDELLRSLTPEQRRYVDWVTSATPEQLAAAFGAGRVAVPRPSEAGVSAR